MSDKPWIDNMTIRKIAESVYDSEITARHTKENRDWFWKLNSEVREIKLVLKEKFNIDIDNIIKEKYPNH